MRFEDADRLLNPDPLALEMGYERAATGVLHVACRTPMPNCTGAMLTWWFESRPTTQRYLWWHPADHIASEWAEGEPGTLTGAIHVATERFGAGPVAHVSIQFRDPAEFFSQAALNEARANDQVSATIVARAGESHTPQRTPEGAMIGSRLLHVARDTAGGLVLRTHYFLGHDLPGIGLPPAVIRQALPDALAPALLQHCYEEFTYLSQLLPALYRAEAAPATAATPW